MALSFEIDPPEEELEKWESWCAPNHKTPVYYKEALRRCIVSIRMAKRSLTMPGIYEHDGQLLYGDGREVETMPEPNKLDELDEKTLFNTFPGSDDAFAVNHPTLSEKTLDNWRTDPGWRQFTPSQMAIVIDALRAANKRIAELEQKIAAEKGVLHANENTADRR